MRIIIMIWNPWTILALFVYTILLAFHGGFVWIWKLTGGVLLYSVLLVAIPYIAPFLFDAIVGILRERRERLM